MNDVLPAGLDAVRLTALVFELATQLHTERAHRLALELAIEQAGLLPLAAAETAAQSPEFQARSRAAADIAIRKLMRAASTPTQVQSRRSRPWPDRG